MTMDYAWLTRCFNAVISWLKGETAILRAIQNTVNQTHQEILNMAGELANLQAADAAIKDTITTGVIPRLDAIEAKLQQLSNAPAGIDPAAVQAVTDDVNALNQSLKDALVRDPAPADTSETVVSGTGNDTVQAG